MTQMKSKSEGQVSWVPVVYDASGSRFGCGCCSARHRAGMGEVSNSNNVSLIFLQAKRILRLR